MTCTLRYGANSALEFDLPQEVFFAQCAQKHAAPIDDPAAAAAAALADPLNFPPISKAITPGDRVVVTLESQIPQVAQVIAGVIHSLVEGGADPSDIAILRAECEETSRPEDPTSLLRPDVRNRLGVICHDPHDRQSLAYLAADRNARPIYLNRALLDADVILPISSARLDGSIGYLGAFGALFPTFSDAKTQQRYRAAKPGEFLARQPHWREETDEAAWLLGVQFMLLVIPGPGESILRTLAGDAPAVVKEGQRLCEHSWRYAIPQKASLVVAGIEGGPEQQTWENFGRALYAASQAVDDNGAILICTEMESQPGPALMCLAEPQDGPKPESVQNEIRRRKSADAIPAALLAEVRERARVFLLSRLDGELVEDIGMGHVSNANEVHRLRRQFESCILLPAAQHALPQVG